MGEGERKKGRVRSVWRPADREGASAHDIGQNNGPLSLPRPGWTSLALGQASALSIISSLPKTSFQIVTSDY